MVTFSKTYTMSFFCKNIENFISSAKYFSEQICSTHDKNYLNTAIHKVMFGQTLEYCFI